MTIGLNHGRVRSFIHGLYLEFIKATAQALPTNTRDSAAIFLVRAVLKTPKNTFIEVCISNMESLDSKFYYSWNRDLAYFIFRRPFDLPTLRKKGASMY